MTVRVHYSPRRPIAVPVGLPLASVSHGQTPGWAVWWNKFAASNDSLGWRLG